MAYSIRIRRMSEGDLERVTTIALETPELRTGTDAAQFYSRNTLRRWIRDKNGLTLVAEASGDFAGFFLGYYMRGTRDGYINAMVIREKYRRSGAGRRLLKKAKETFKRKGCNHIFGAVKTSNQAALGFFQANGMETGENFRYVEMML